MDFSLNEEEQAIHDLALQILGDHLDAERLMAIEAGGEWFDADTWKALAAAGLVGIALPEDVGGSGQDLVALAQVLRAQGATVAPLPLLPTMVAAAAVDRFGTDEQRRSWLPGVVAGDIVLAPAVQEVLDEDLAHPGATFEAGTVRGAKVMVEYAERADRLVVSATGPDGPVLVLVDPTDPTVTVATQPSTRRQPLAEVTFEATPAEPLGDGVAWLLDRLMAGVCATQVGVTERALQLTAEFTSTREQFGRPIATFQAVTQRLADQYINVNGIRLTTWSALWRLANDLDAEEDLRIAKWWASERAQDVAHATQHCHGGMGVSVDYPLHRYTLWNTHLRNSLGAGTRQLRAIGAAMAADDG